MRTQTLYTRKIPVNIVRCVFCINYNNHLGIPHVIQSVIAPEEAAICGVTLRSAVLASPAEPPVEFDRIIVPEFDYCTFTADSNFVKMNRWNNGLAKLSVTSNKQSNTVLDHPCLISESEIVAAIARQRKYDEEEKQHNLAEKKRNEGQRNVFLEEQTGRELEEKEERRRRAEKEEIDRKQKEELEKKKQIENKVPIHIRLFDVKFVGKEVNIWVLLPLLKYKYNKNKIAGKLGQLDESNTNAECDCKWHQCNCEVASRY